LKQKRLHLISLLCLLCIVSFATNVYAVPPSAPPSPRQINLGDELVFHMTPAEYAAQGYPESGLYLDGALIYTTELWTANRLFFSEDAMSFLVIANDGGLLANQGIVWFYEQGVLVYSYTARDLFGNLERAQRTRDRLGWPLDYVSPIFSWDEGDYDRANNVLRLTTVNEGGNIVFCLSTGQILSKSVSGQYLTTIAVMGISLLAIAGIIFIFRKKFFRLK